MRLTTCAVLQYAKTIQWGTNPIQNKSTEKNTPTSCQSVTVSVKSC